MTEPVKRIEERTHHDGTLEVRTLDTDPYFAEARARADAELQAGIDTLRAQGFARPVRLTRADDGLVAVETWKELLPGLQAQGIAIFSARPHGVDYIVRADRARELLAAVFGKEARRLFRTATWPVGYYTVGIGSEQHDVYESRTFKDQAATEGKGK